MVTALDLPSQILLDSETLKRWTVEEYHRLSKLGLLDSNERTELIAGQITVMAAKGVPHVTALRFLAIQLDNFLHNKPFFVSTQDPIRLSDLSEPEPDLVIAQGDASAYIDHHPEPKEICLVVEVADTTLKKDCEIKDKLYAKSNISEYWVVDLKHRSLHIFRQPTAQGYSSHLILSETNEISPEAFPELSLDIASMLPPKS
ncbi:MAG: Uma2 family endonuclease [Cyanobacteria bacterium P01_D01_bin.36]